MYKDLAAIHASYNIYPEDLLASAHERNIVTDIKTIPDLKYLSDFYESYLKEYCSTVSNNNPNVLAGAARSIDLPFIGQNALSHHKAKFGFYFEGSLQNANYLSITVLSCLWIFQNISQYRHIIERYWKTHSYLRIYNALRITTEIASNAYVADSFRIGKANGKMDTKHNRALMEREISLLNPELIILVGSTAKYIAGQELLAKNQARVQCIPFPTVRKTKEDKQAAEAQYAELGKLMHSLL